MNLQELTEWIEQEGERLNFGTIQLTLKYHNGKCKHIDKTVSVSEIPEATRSEAHYERKV